MLSYPVFIYPVLLSCVIFMFVVIMFMGGIHYKLFNVFSILFPNMYISSCIACLYVYKFEKIKFDLISIFTL